MRDPTARSGLPGKRYHSGSFRHERLLVQQASQEDSRPFFARCGLEMRCAENPTLLCTLRRKPGGFLARLKCSVRDGRIRDGPPARLLHQEAWPRIAQLRSNVVIPAVRCSKWIPRHTSSAGRPAPSRGAAGFADRPYTVSTGSGCRHSGRRAAPRPLKFVGRSPWRRTAVRRPAGSGEHQCCV